MPCSGYLQRKGIWFQLNRFNTQGLRPLCLKLGGYSTDPWTSPLFSVSIALFSAHSRESVFAWLTTSCYLWAQPWKPLPPPSFSKLLKHLSSSNINTLPYHLLFYSVTWLRLFFFSTDSSIIFFFFLNSSFGPHCYSACNGTILPLWTGMRVGTKVLRKESSYIQSIKTIICRDLCHWATLAYCNLANSRKILLTFSEYSYYIVQWQNI